MQRGRGACSHQVAQGEDASHPRGLKHEVRTPQTQTGAQCLAHSPDPQQAGSSSTSSGTRQDPHPFAGQADGVRTPEKHSRARRWSTH